MDSHGHDVRSPHENLRTRPLGAADRLGRGPAGRAPKPDFAVARAEIVAAMPGLEPLARGWSRDEQAAADLMQDTLERALRQVDRFRAGSNAGAWLRTIMYHLAVDGSRRRRRDGRMRERYWQTRPEETVPAPDQDEPAASLTQSTDLAEVREVAQKLREPLRATFLLWLDERLTYKEIGRRQQIPANTVATRLLRARRHMRQLRPSLRDPRGDA